MSRSLAAVVVLALGAVFPLSAQSDIIAARRALVERLTELEDARQRRGATPADVDRALDLFTDAGVYEHPSVGARVVGREARRRGMLSHLGELAEIKTTIGNFLVSDRVAVFQSRSTGAIERDGALQPFAREGVRLVEFDGDKIARVVDYVTFRADTATSDPAGVMDEFHARDAARQLHGAGGTELARALSMFADTARYESPGDCEPRAGRPAIGASMGEHVGDVRAERLREYGRLVGPGVVAVNLSRTIDFDRNGARATATRHGIRVFEVSDGRIVRLIDYWS